MKGLFNFKLGGKGRPIGQMTFEQRNDKDGGGNATASEKLYSGRKEYSQGFRNAKTSAWSKWCKKGLIMDKQGGRVGHGQHCKLL